MCAIPRTWAADLGIRSLGIRGIPRASDSVVGDVDSDSDHGVDVELSAPSVSAGICQEDLPDANMSGTDVDSDGGVDVALDTDAQSGAAAAPLLFVRSLSPPVAPEVFRSNNNLQLAHMFTRSTHTH